MPELAWWKFDNWYEEFIEPEVRDIVRYLRNRGINTESSCGHDMTIQCQYIPKGKLEELHCLVYNYLHKKGMKKDFVITIKHQVIDGHQYTGMELSLNKGKEGG